MIFFKWSNTKIPIWYYTCIECYDTKAQSKSKLTQFHNRTARTSVIPYCIKEWNKLDAKIRNLPFVSRFKKSLLIYLKTDKNSIFDVHNPIGIKLLILVTWMNINFTLISGILLIHFAFLMPKLKLPLTISCFAFFFWTKNETPWKLQWSWLYIIKSLWWWYCKYFIKWII